MHHPSLISFVGRRDRIRRFARLTLSFFSMIAVKETEARNDEIGQRRKCLWKRQERDRERERAKKKCDCRRRNPGNCMPILFPSIAGPAALNDRLSQSPPSCSNNRTKQSHADIRPSNSSRQQTGGNSLSPSPHGQTVQTVLPFLCRTIGQEGR